MGKHLRSSIKELVKLRKKHVTQLKRWTTKYLHFDGKYKGIQKLDRTISSLLQDSEKTNEHLIEQNDQSIEKLIHTYKSIPKRGQSSTLKSRLDKEHSDVERSNKILTKLKTEQIELEMEKVRMEATLTSRTLDQATKSDLQRKKQDLSTKRRTIDRDIEIESQRCDQATEDYEKTENIFLNDSQQDEKAHLQSMKSVLKDFTEALKLSSSSTSVLARKQYSYSSTESDDDDYGESV